MTSDNWLHVIAGPMFSGKTDELIRQLRRQEVKKRRVKLYRPAVDTRSMKVKSRSGAEYHAEVVLSASDILIDLKADYLPNVVAIDEAQFFDDYIVNVVEYAADAGALVIVSGLDKDFLGRPFGAMPDLLGAADEITMLTAICTRCYGDASRTQRLINGVPAKKSDPLVLIGGMGDDKYEARCRLHHEVPA